MYRTEQQTKMQVKNDDLTGPLPQYADLEDRTHKMPKNIRMYSDLDFIGYFKAEVSNDP